MDLEGIGLVLDLDFGRDLYGVCVFGFGGIDEASVGFFHQLDHQFGASLWDSVSSFDFWRKRKNDPTILLGYRHHFHLGIDLSGAQLLAKKEKRGIDSQSLIFPHLYALK